MGLSTQDIDAIRGELTAGRRPKVVFAPSAGQMAGQAGQVTRLDDPSAGEWVVVRFGKDELHFSPGDLSRPQRATRRKAAAPPRHSVDDVPARPAGPRVVAPEPAIRPAPVSPAPVSPVRRKTGGTSAGTAKPRPPKELTVTLVWRDRTWTVQASRGAKVVAKPAPVQSADALRMVGMLDVPAVQRLVEQIAAAERAAAEEQAERLRQQVAEAEERLAQAEARLAALHDIDSPPMAS